ncbi:hypothetical protein [Leptospira sp. 'Mane']|uniref:hypothetical protein n=1 Tax=Leptospira sp. 'Mane' TaxID=3387407 RepID=UPI00398B38B4
MKQTLNADIEVTCGRYRFSGKCRKNGTIPTKMSFVLYATQKTLSTDPPSYVILEPIRLFWARINRDGSNVIWFNHEQLTLNESMDILDQLFLYAEKNMEIV